MPFVCSGGVGEGSQLVAALALGADGVSCGTRLYFFKLTSNNNIQHWRARVARESRICVRLRFVDGCWCLIHPSVAHLLHAHTNTGWCALCGAFHAV